MEDFKLIEERENLLFNRREIKFSVNANITPSNAEVGNFILEKFSAPLETIKIKKISGRFGSHNFIITTNIYSSKEDKESIERKSKKDDALKPAEKPVEEKSEETQKEESKENSPTEEKNEAPKDVPSEEGKEVKEEPKQEEKVEDKKEEIKEETQKEQVQENKSRENKE